MNKKKIKKVELPKQSDLKQNITGLELFNIKRVEGEVNLVNTVYTYFSKHYSEKAANVFINNPEINNIKELNHIAQRIIINRWFMDNIYKYRARVTDKDVSEIILYPTDEGDVDTWLELIERVVVPFFKVKNVLAI